MGAARRAYKSSGRKKPSGNERALWMMSLDDCDGDVIRASHKYPRLYELIHGKPPEPIDDRPEELLDG